MSTGGDRVVCPACHCNNMPGQVKCFNCGAALQSPAAASPPQATKAIPGQTWYGVFMLIFGLWLLFGPMHTISYLFPGASPKPTVESWQKQGSYVRGVVLNDTRRTFSYVQVEFNCYDYSGAQVGSTIANINNLEPGGRWKFEAYIFEPRAVSAKLKGITAY